MRAFKQWLRGSAGAGAYAAALVFAGGFPPGAVAAPATSPAFTPRAAAPVPGSFTAISYHEVRDEVRDYPDPFAVDSAALVAQFAWLRGHGYTPVTLAAIAAARAGGAPLPEKAVLLTFDDAYLSFYTRVFPILREFNYPAVLAIVGKWIEQPAAQAAGQAYGEKASVLEASFPTWAQLREMANSGLVEMASHTYDLHRGILANPQGNLQPAATARLYDAASGTYESDQHWRERVSEDLARNSALIERMTGQRPRAVVWPYGSYSGELASIAAGLGMAIGVTLDDGLNTPRVPLSAMHRVLLLHNPPLAEFAAQMAGEQLPRPVRAVEVALDAVYDAVPAIQERNLSALLDRVLALGATHAIVHAFSDVPGPQSLPQAYFPNRQVPVRADLFNRVAWQLATRSEVKVCAAVPPALLRDASMRAAATLEDLARAANFDCLYFMPPEQGHAEDVGALVPASARLVAVVRKWRAPVALARGIDAAAASPQALDALAQGASFVMLASSRGIPAWAERPGAGVTAMQPGAPARLVVLLGAPGGVAAPGEALAERMRGLQRDGVMNFGFRDDDFLRDQPPLVRIAPALSLRDTLR